MITRVSIPSITGAALMALVAATLSAQEAGELKARELFYNPVVPKAATNPASQPAQKTTADSTKTKVIKKVVTPKQTKVESTTQEVVSESRSRITSAPAQKSESSLPVVKAALASGTGRPLAIRYSIEKRIATGRFDEVDADTTFHSGDRIRISVESNDDGFLYIVQQGTSKNWEVLFPSSDINAGNNQVKGNSRLTIPSEGGAFTLKGDPGAEKIFIVLSRKEVPDLEKLIYSLSNPQQPGDEQQAKPLPVNRQKSTPGGAVVMLASNRPIDNGTFENIRTGLVSRDLVFEKVDDNNEYGTKEKAVYAGTPDTSDNARVVAPLTLKHQ